ncbi:uncharacterized protein UTRI_06161 [Ustilago trichophora]|uniref:Uncharacterized protein n=1 Tax=Ustilago trichophora TaxID=86804 RepID=A0A5C3EFK3_9BASI|nr:uncharacterized protein UTRI_06161 [Ustilago trichophora]
MATDTADDTKPLVYILNEASNLDEWLTSHPPSRLGKPAAFNNGISPQPIWVLGVKSVDEIAELSPAAPTEATFVKARQMERESTAKVSDIQNDDEIPVRSSSKSAGKSKKQCRTEVQDRFHEQIMLMALDHPMWRQGRWTMLVRPQQIDNVFAELAKSLASGDLHKQGSIIALRARALPFEEGSFETSANGHKRRKSSVSFSPRRGSSSKSPSSARHAHDTPLGIDIFFHPVWNTNAAREVLRAVAEVSGRMASFCKSSLYSRLGIGSGHSLASQSTLYTSKHMASPADAKAWVKKHVPGDIAMDEPQISSFGDAGPSSKPVGASSSAALMTTPEKPAVGEKVKRELDQEASADHTSAKADEPALKKARNGEPSSNEQQASRSEAPAPSGTVKESQPDIEETQDEPLLPFRRPAAKFAQDLCLSPLQAAFREYHPHAVQTEEVEAASKPADTAAAAEIPAVKTPIASKSDVASEMEDESQTQIEPSSVMDESNIADVPTITIVGQPSDKNEDRPASWERNTKMELEPGAVTTEAKAVEESRAAPIAKENVEKAAEASVDAKGRAKPGKDVKENAAPATTKGEDAADGTRPIHTADSDATKNEGRCEQQAARSSEKPKTESTEVETMISDKVQEAPVEAPKSVQHKAPAIEAVDTKAAPVTEKAPDRSEEKKHVSGAVISKDEAGDKKHATESSDSDLKTQVSMTHTAHTVETVEMVTPATEKRTQEPRILIHDHKTAAAAEEAGALKEDTTAGEELPQLSVKLEESSSESAKITVEQSQDGSATRRSDGHTTIRPPAEASDASKHVTEEGTKREDVNVDDAHKASVEVIEASTTDPASSAGADKTESQTSASAPEMSLDDLIVEGAIASPMVLSQPLDEATAAK